MAASRRNSSRSDRLCGFFKAAGLLTVYRERSRLAPTELSPRSPRWPSALLLQSTSVVHCTAANLSAPWMSRRKFSTIRD